MRTLISHIALLLWIFSLPSTAQSEEWRLMRQGNKAFRNNNFKQAEHYYRQAQELHPNSPRAAFNLGDAYLAQKNAQAALQEYERATKGERNPMIRAMAHHNVGYVHHTNQQYDKAIEAYKAALRLNPNDEDTRYNLVLAQKQRKDANENQQQKQQKPQEQNQNSSQKEAKSEQQEHSQKPPQSDSQMSQDNAEQLLQLSRQAEQQTRKRVQQAQQPRARQLDKNW